MVIVILQFDPSDLEQFQEGLKASYGDALLPELITSLFRDLADRKADRDQAALFDQYIHSRPSRNGKAKRLKVEGD